jgi:ABC-type phosphate/phosphonate transport system substrate-binding protein
MYNLSEMVEANEAFWSMLRQRLLDRGLDIEDVQFDMERPPVPDTFGPDIYFTQLCGYPFMTRFANQGALLGAPVYAFPGCTEATHVAFFIVRSEESAKSVEEMRGRIFGCNSLFSNSGMNLPRLSIARIANGRPFFSAVHMTGGHGASLDRLAEGAIDLCSIDCVTWGFFEKFRPTIARQFRIIGETPRSPALPFVTSAATSIQDQKAMVGGLREMMLDPATSSVRNALNLTGIIEVDPSIYQRLIDFQSEAATLGYAAIQ